VGRVSRLMLVATAVVGAAFGFGGGFVAATIHPGPHGPRGVVGPAGPTGPQGLEGPPGAAGQPASSFRLDCTTTTNNQSAVLFTNVVTSVTQNSDGTLNIETGSLGTTCTVATFP